MFSATLLMLGVVAKGQTVSVDDVEAVRGETVEFHVNLSGITSDKYSSLDFDIQFPESGVTTVGTSFNAAAWPGTMADVGYVDATGKATFAAGSAYNMIGTEIDGIVSVSFTVDESVELGDYPVTLKNIALGYNIKDSDSPADVTFIVNVVAAHTLILDENSTTAPTAATDVDVRVIRTINANEWGTICLPFAMTEEQVKAAFGDDVQLGDFTGYDYDETADVMTVNFADATAIEANHPYIIKVSDNVTEFTADGVTIEPEDNPCVEYDNGLTGKKRKVLGTFAGTYVADFDFYAEAENYPLFISGNKFYYATENTRHMKAFRAYFDFVDYLAEAEGASSRITMSFDNTTTDIVNVEHPAVTIGHSVYDLQGRQIVNGKLVNRKYAKGLYIVNGKKVIK